MHFVVVGLSHKTAPLPLRERIAVPGARVPDFLARILGSEDISEGMLISTCNRVEAYVVAKHVQRAAAAVIEAFSDASGLAGKDLVPHVYVRNTGEAIAHLFRVAASLDSMMVGETQISGQVKEAYTRAVQNGSTGVYLNKIVHKALNVAKKVRSETAIGRHPVSISYAAVLLAEKIFGDLAGVKVLLLGAGETGALAARHLRERQVGEIRIANRTRDKAEILALELEGSVVDFEGIRDHLDEADIVVASTGAADLLLSAADVREAMRRRRGRPMFFIDISVPRNIDPEVNSLENVYLYDVDHLQGIVTSNRKEREKEAKRAEILIEREVEGFGETLRHIELSPTIEQLSKKLDQIRLSEVEKTLARTPGLTAEQKKVLGESLDACTRALVNKILHEPILQMKSQMSGEETEQGSAKYSEILKKLFKLE